MFKTYDEWRASAPEDDSEQERQPCPVCTGDRDADPCSEDCDAIMKRATRRAAIQGLYNAAFRALLMAKLYRREGHANDHRITDCVAKVRVYRASIRALRVS